MHIAKQFSTHLSGMSLTSSSVLSGGALDLIADWFRALSEPSRLRIIRALEGGDKNINELADATGLTQGNVSRHVQSLVDAGIVGRRREGISTVCFIADKTIVDLCENVCASIQQRLANQAQRLIGPA
jgi:DNA-binding transcriptional ArsR family regulator